MPFLAKIVVKLRFVHVCRAETFHFCSCLVFPASERDSSCSLKNGDNLTSEFKGSHRNLCFILTFHKICIFFRWRECIEILEFLYMRGMVIYSSYTREKIQYFTLLPASGLQSQVITTISRTFIILVMNNTIFWVSKML